MRAAYYLLIVIALSAAAPASAQSRPDIPERARIRIHVQRADTSGRESLPLRGTGVAHRVGSDSIAFRLDGASEVLVAPWVRVQSLEWSKGIRPIRFGERVGAVAILTALGAALGYSSWHTCNEPEREVTLSCIVFPRRLGTAVRGGAWLGFGVGLPFAVALRDVEEWRRLDRPFVPSPFVGHSARSGLMLGASFRF